MAEVAAAGGVPGASRVDRRKARTRQALIDAAVRLIAEGRGGRASIAEITEEADIGFGSFCNHFGSKEQLFGTAFRRAAGTVGAGDRPGLRGHQRPCGGVRRLAADLRAAGLDAPRYRPVPDRRRPGVPGRVPRAGATRPARHPGRASRRALHRHRRADRAQRRGLAACSGCCGRASGIRNRWTRHPWTSSPKPACGCSASPRPKPPASPRPRCPLSGRSAGNLDLVDDGRDGMSVAFPIAHLLPRLTADCRRISPGRGLPRPDEESCYQQPERNPPTWAKNAAPPPSALALNNPKLPASIS